MTTRRPWERRTAAASSRSAADGCGSFGIVSPRILKAFDIDTEVFYAEMSWDRLMIEAERHSVRFSEIPKFPAVSRDLALLIDQQIPFSRIKEIALASEKKLLKEVTLFDVYEGKNLPQGKKSYAVNFVLQDEEKTLTDQRIDEVMKRIHRNMEKELDAQLR